LYWRLLAVQHGAVKLAPAELIKLQMLQLPPLLLEDGVKCRADKLG